MAAQGPAVGGMNFLADTPGTLALVAPWKAEDAGPLVSSARARGKQAIVYVPPFVIDTGPLKANWRELLARVIADTPDAIGYYIFDEPGLHDVSNADQDAVAAMIPPGKIVMMSLSRPELNGGQYVTPRVNLLGAILYSSHRITPPMVAGYLDKLAAYGRPMYLNLDAMRIGTLRIGGCASITEAEQRQALDLNDAIIAWGVGRDIRANVAFIWQSVIGAEDICGAIDLPLIRDYMQNLAN